MQAEGLGTFSAGIMHPDDSDAVQTEEKIWDLTMPVNCKGVWWGCKYGIQAMLANPVDESKGLKPGGSIINTASFMAKLGAATPRLAWCRVGDDLRTGTRELAMVHARDGIRVNALCLGPLRTPPLMDYLNTPEKRERRVVHLPMGRFGEAVEQARGAFFLACEDSSLYVTGTDFMVNGGAHACYVTPTGEPASDPPKSLASA
ncbi:hypothetical protein PtB15_7B789 [Puccinia triticina]|nr:hypothetical protein PtB15_7B789 [Puccinia triticina]